MLDAARAAVPAGGLNGDAILIDSFEGLGTTFHATPPPPPPPPLAAAAPPPPRRTAAPAANDSKRHLLVDMQELESVVGARFVMNSPTCDRKPVLEPDAAWEVQANLSFNVYHSIVAEPAGRILAFYNLLNDSNTEGFNTPYFVGYAESIDGGATFTKPILNQFSLNGSTANNIIGPGMSTPAMHEGCSVWIDPSESLGGRYVSQAKVFKGKGEGTLGFATSKDGKKWAAVEPGWGPGGGGCDTQTTVFSDPWTGDFALYTRNWTRTPSPEYRAIRRLTCAKGVLSPSTVSKCWSDQHIVMQPDATDRCHVSEPCDVAKDMAMD